MKYSTEISRCNGRTEINTIVIVEFDYQPAEKQELNYPGCDEEIVIYSVERLDGRDFDVDIDEERILEAECLTAWHSQ